MSTVKISELTALTSADAADEFVVVDDSAGVTKKITQGNLNVLIENADDYDEGTWTPTLGFVTYTDNGSSGKYVKIGNYVFASGKVDVTGLNTSDNSVFNIGGLPFSITADTVALITMGFQDSTLFTGAPTDVHFGSDTGIVRMYLTEFDGTQIAYNSGYINSSGVAYIAFGYYAS